MRLGGSSVTVGEVLLQINQRLPPLMWDHVGVVSPLTGSNDLLRAPRRDLRPQRIESSTLHAARYRPKTHPAASLRSPPPLRPWPRDRSRTAGSRAPSG